MWATLDQTMRSEEYPSKETDMCYFQDHFHKQGCGRLWVGSRPAVAVQPCLKAADLEASESSAWGGLGQCSQRKAVLFCSGRLGGCAPWRKFIGSRQESWRCCFHPPQSAPASPSEDRIFWEPPPAHKQNSNLQTPTVLIRQP